MTDDSQRFTTMYDECRQRVWAYVVSQAGRQVADEVVSETFAIAWRRFDDVPDPALPWLLGVARNVLRDTIRAEIRRESLAGELRAWTEEDHAEQVAERLGRSQGDGLTDPGRAGASDPRGLAGAHPARRGPGRRMFPDDLPRAAAPGPQAACPGDEGDTDGPVPVPGAQPQ